MGHLLYIENEFMQAQQMLPLLSFIVFTAQQIISPSIGKSQLENLVCKGIFRQALICRYIHLCGQLK